MGYVSDAKNGRGKDHKFERIHISLRCLYFVSIIKKKTDNLSITTEVGSSAPLNSATAQLPRH
jgi:hypothetical protein